MQEEIIQIIPRKIVLTKDNNSFLIYDYDYVSTEKACGYTELKQVFKGTQLFHNIKDKLINEKLDATYHYKKTFNGNARLELTNICDENGVSLLV